MNKVKLEKKEEKEKLLFVLLYLKSQFRMTLWKLIFWYISSQIIVDGINFEILISKFSSMWAKK